MSSNRNHENIGVAASGVVVLTLLAGAAYDPHSPRVLLVVVACLFSLPLIGRLAEFLFGPEKMRRVGPRLSPIVVGVWFFVFGALLAYGGLRPESRISGGLPFLSAKTNRRVGSAAFVVVGAGIALLGVLAAHHGLSRISRDERAPESRD